MTRTCAVEGCGRSVFTRSWCSAHYNRWLRNGDVEASRPVGVKAAGGPEASFWAKVNKTEACWLWTAAQLSRYGVFSVRTPNGTKTVRAHRYAYELAYGSIPDGLLVCHRCDTPLCVRPDHLFLGTQSDNVKDMHSKGRGGEADVKGERNGQAKVTAEDVRQIRTRFAAGESPTAIAREYGLTPPSVYDIAKRRSWKHVD